MPGGWPPGLAADTVPSAGKGTCGTAGSWARDRRSAGASLWVRGRGSAGAGLGLKDHGCGSEESQDVRS